MLKHPRSLCCTSKRDNIQNRHCLHVEEEGLSGNPYPKLQTRVQLQFPHKGTGLTLKWTKPAFPPAADPTQNPIWPGCSSTQKQMPFCSPPGTQMETVLSRKGLWLEQMSVALSEGASTLMLNLEFAKYASVRITYKLWSAHQGKHQRRGRRGGY